MPEPQYEENGKGVVQGTPSCAVEFCESTKKESPGSNFEEVGLGADGSVERIRTERGEIVTVC